MGGVSDSFLGQAHGLYEETKFTLLKSSSTWLSGLGV